MNWTDLMAAPEDYFVVNYWGEEDYLGMGHFDGAFQYTPKASFGTDTLLATLPTDMPIAVYCYSGQTGSQMAAYLTILGYQAYQIRHQRGHLREHDQPQVDRRRTRRV